MWSIGEIINNVKVPQKCAKELYDSQEYEGELWNSLEDVLSEGKLYFNPDHMESMDYLEAHDAFLKILSKYKVKGDICFGSLEGDNAGSFWGYRFDGKGKAATLEGKLVWEEKRKNCR